MIKDKNILLGICGSIAAYKSAYLVRLFVKNNAQVKVIMTAAARDFVGPLTFSTLSKNSVYSEFYNSSTSEWTNHVELADWADLYLIAPATSNMITKFATGLCDNLLSAVYLSCTCPVIIAPAMDREMFKHPAIQKNIQVLQKRGNKIIAPEKGELASGLEGVGRLAEPESIVRFLEELSI